MREISVPNYREVLEELLCVTGQPKGIGSREVESFQS